MSTRLPRAPGAPLPELAEFLAPRAVHFVQRPSARSLERYVTGLLTEHPVKHCDTLAQVLPGTSEQRRQYLLTDMAWDHADLNRQRVRRMLALPTEGDAVLLVDDTGVAKQGARSVGVQRQYSGTLGKTGNCQVAVTCHYAERTLAWPVDTRLYLPRRWTDDDLTVAMTRTSDAERTDGLLAGVPRRAWQPVTWAEGSHGALHAKAYALRCYRVDGDGQRHVGGLLGQRASRGLHRAVADWLLQAALRTPLRRLPPLRTYPLRL